MRRRGTRSTWPSHKTSETDLCPRYKACSWRQMIRVRNLRKHYRVHERAPGVAAALRSLFHRRYKTVAAVDDIDFDISAGERVGFLGPNGAGKTTTLKV